MAEKFVSERNLKFLLYEVLDAPSLTQYPYYADHSRESFDMALETAMKIVKNLMEPRLSEMDKNPPEFVNGHVKVHRNPRLSRPAQRIFFKSTRPRSSN